MTRADIAKPATADTVNGLHNADQLRSSIGSEVKPARSTKQAGRRSRDKGNRIEREIIDRRKALGTRAERYALSGARRFSDKGHDVDIYLFGRDESPLVAKVKGRKNGAGCATLEKWLDEFDALFLRRNSADPLVLVPWRIWTHILERVRR
jgi:hypothetical protein